MSGAAPTLPPGMRKRPVTHGVLDRLLEDLWRDVAQLRARVAELEARPKALEYKGVWSPETTYQAGDVTTHQGSMWVAKIVSTGCRPGEATSADFWVLSVKRGRDGRDAR